MTTLTPERASSPISPADSSADARPSRAHRRKGPSPSSIIIMAILAIVTCYFLVPVYWVFVSATKSTEGLFSTNGFWFGGGFHLVENVREVLTARDGVFPRWSLNSVLYAGGGALIATYLAAAAGYALAKFQFRGKKLAIGLILAGVMVPGTATALPLFFLFSSVGLTNTYWSVLIPSIVSPFGLFLSWVYCSSAVSDELLEAGRIDGAGEARVFHQIVLPQLVPAMVTVFLFQFIGIWNNYFLPLVMLADEKLFPLTLGLANWNSLTNFDTSYYLLTITGSMLSIIPLGILILILQRFWRGGLTEGSVKG